GQVDPSLERAISETKLSRLDHRIQALDPTATDYPDRKAALEQEKREFQIAEARRRVERYPNDLTFHFELGELLYKQGKISDAIAEFQKAQQNPNKKIGALYYLGLCFAKLNRLDMA